MFKFLHAADIHLDSPLRGLDRYEECPAEKIRGATREALKKLVELAREERVKFVLIAGDVYDGDWGDYHTGLWFAKQMAQLRDADIEVFLIRGNHDAANQMTQSLRLPDNVINFDVSRPQTCSPKRDLPVKIHGQGFATRAVIEDLSANYPAADPGCFNVGMLHTSAGRLGHDNYAPCKVEALRSKGYGYWALGHVHAREILDESGGPIVFPGNVQGRHIRESGPKGCMLVTVENDQRSSAEFRPLDMLRWETCRLESSSFREIDDVLRGFQEKLPALLAAAEGRTLAIRVEVVGTTAAHETLLAKAHHLTGEIRNQANMNGEDRVWVESVKLRTRPPGRGDDEPGEGPLGELDRILAGLRDDPTSLKRLADAELGPLRDVLLSNNLIATEKIDLDSGDWLRAVLDQVGPLLAERFEASRAAR